MNCDLDTSIPEWIIEHPETSIVFDEMGLNSSCAGKSLHYVCVHQGFSPQDVLQRLRQAVIIASSIDRRARET
tara:strand:- start:93750 stop:93968 length:219 start_codon:yes stop_codon:yes gene_type:complete